MDVGKDTPLANLDLSTLATENYQKKNQQLSCIKLGIFILEECIPGREMRVKSACVYLLKRFCLTNICCEFTLSKTC